MYAFLLLYCYTRTQNMYYAFTYSLYQAEISIFLI